MVEYVEPLTIVIMNVNIKSVNEYVNIVLKSSDPQWEILILLECPIIPNGDVEAAPSSIPAALGERNSGINLVEISST